MSRMVVSLAALAALTVAANAQSPTPAPSPSAAAGSSADASDASKSGSGDTANQETYKMKNGQMYQPPKVRPASPAQDLGVYGRT